MKNILINLIDRLLLIEMDIVFDDFQSLLNYVGNPQSSFRFL